MKSDCFVSVVIPLRNDADIVEAVLSDVVATMRAAYKNYEIVLVDDGSTDETVERVLARLDEFDSVRLLRLSRSFGQEIAISAGLDSVIGDFIAIMLPDTDPPGLIPEMVERAREGSDIVFGIARQRGPESLVHRLGVALFYFYCRHVMRSDVPKNTTHFRMLSRQAVNAVTRIKDRMRYLRTLSTYVGYSKQSFFYDLIQRRAKPRRKGLWQSIKLAVNIIVANSLHPLRIVSWLGLAASAVNLLYVVYVVLIYFFKEEVAEGWVTLSLQSAGMFLLLFLTLAVLCEYIGRLLSETAGRPLYYVLSEHNSASLIRNEERRNVVMDSTDGL